MEPGEYERLADVESRHFWFVGTRAVVREALRRVLDPTPGLLRVVDLGCGTGFTIEGVADAALRVGLDPAKEALAHARGRRGVSFVAASAEALPFRDESFDVALALDVLEHLPHDAVAVREARRVLRPRGFLVATVPAFRALWSRHDEALHHLRRYRRSEVRRLLEDAGFEVLHAGYFDFFLFPAIAAVRLARRLVPRRGPLVSDVSMPPAPLNAVLGTILRAERHLVGRVPLPFGVSVIAVARRA